VSETPANPPAVQPLVISAPFGNYLQPAGTTPTLGTFTAARRRGRVHRTVQTVRYYRRLGAWVNRIGLRNPGLDWLTAKVRGGRVDVSDKLVSIHGFSAEDWAVLLRGVAVLGPMGIELNMSCPNVGHIDWPERLFGDAVATGAAVVVKLPPIHYRLMAQQAVDQGVVAFHCCNTLPVPAGGMSGRPLQPMSLACIEWVRQRWGDRAAGGPMIVAGGGIGTVEDIDRYAQAGADRFALGTKLMHPRYLWTERPIGPLIERARMRAG
jgi:dihydroorotate dehydrogenase